MGQCSGWCQLSSCWSSQLPWQRQGSLRTPWSGLRTIPTTPWTTLAGRRTTQTTSLTTPATTLTTWTGPSLEVKLTSRGQGDQHVWLCSCLLLKPNCRRQGGEPQGQAALPGLLPGLTTTQGPSTMTLPCWSLPRTRPSPRRSSLHVFPQARRRTTAEALPPSLDGEALLATDQTTNNLNNRDSAL